MKINQSSYFKELVDKDKTEQIYKECIEDKWDSKYLDPNKYRTEIKDGKN